MRQLGVDLTDGWIEEQFDHHSWVLAAWDGPCPVATIRSTPPVDGEALELNLLGMLDPDVARPTTCELTRFAVDPSSGGRGTGPWLLGRACQWLLTHTAMTDYVAYSRASTLPLLRRVGATVIDGPFEIVERRCSDYYVIAGLLDDVVERTRGITFESAVRQRTLASVEAGSL